MYGRRLGRPNGDVILINASILAGSPRRKESVSWVFNLLSFWYDIKKENGQKAAK